MKGSKGEDGSKVGEACVHGSERCAGEDRNAREMTSTR